MTVFRISEVASLLDVSSDTVRRWVDSGRLAAEALLGKESLTPEALRGTAGRAVRSPALPVAQMG